MKSNEVKILVQKFFNGETTRKEEQSIERYFHSRDIEEDLKEYQQFFLGISDLKQTHDSSGEEEIMNLILKKENIKKIKYRRLWQTISGIAASILIIFGGIIIYENQQSGFNDSFDDPDTAYAYAKQTLQYIAIKYDKGISTVPDLKNYYTAIQQVSKIEKLEQASKPFIQSISSINKGFDELDQLKNINKK